MLLATGAIMGVVAVVEKFKALKSSNDHLRLELEEMRRREIQDLQAKQAERERLENLPHKEQVLRTQDILQTAKYEAERAIRNAVAEREAARRKEEEYEKLLAAHTAKSKV